MVYFTSLFPRWEITNIQTLIKREGEAKIFLPDSINLINKDILKNRTTIYLVQSIHVLYYVLNIYFNQNNNIWHVHLIKEGEVTFKTIFKRNFAFRKTKSFFCLLCIKRGYMVIVVTWLSWLHGCRGYMVIIPDRSLFLFWFLVAM